MIKQNTLNREETSLRQNNQNEPKIHNIRTDTNNNINKEHNRVNNNYIENEQTNNNSDRNVGNKKKSECQEFFEPDCCFCSNSCCCNCRDPYNYPEINAFNALIFTIISELAILSIILFFKNGHNILSFFEDYSNDLFPVFVIIFTIEIFIYLPFVISCIPSSESDYPSWASDECCKTIFSIITCLLCCCCFCCCNKNDLLDFTSQWVRYIYKTGFYFCNIFYFSLINYLLL